MGSRAAAVRVFSDHGTAARKIQTTDRQTPDRQRCRCYRSADTRPAALQLIDTQHYRHKKSLAEQSCRHKTTLTSDLKQTQK